MALSLTDKEKIINYIMNTPYNTNWAVLSSMLDEGDWSKLKQYIEITPKNMNKKVLESLLTIIEPIDEVYRTVLYTDGTLIINESSRNEAANVALHGQPANIYDPFDLNGATNVDKYIFTSDSQRPWDSQALSVRSVEIGSNIQPTSTACWFSMMTNCTSINFTGLNTSAVTDMYNMFGTCQALTSLDVSNFNTSAVINMGSMFNGCQALTSLDVSNFNTSMVTDMNNMFNGCQTLTSLDVSNFNTSAVTDMYDMFNGCQALITIYASVNFVVTQVMSSSKMFGNMSTNLVGGAGTVWASSNPKDKTYAHIDGGVSNPGYFTAK